MDYDTGNAGNEGRLVHVIEYGVRALLVLDSVSVCPGAYNTEELRKETNIFKISTQEEVITRQANPAILV